MITFLVHKGSTVDRFVQNPTPGVALKDQNFSRKLYLGDKAKQFLEQIEIDTKVFSKIDPFD